MRRKQMNVFKCKGHFGNRRMRRIKHGGLQKKPQIFKKAASEEMKWWCEAEFCYSTEEISTRNLEK